MGSPRAQATILLSILLGLWAADAPAGTLTTQSYVVTIESNCAEGEVTCDKVTYAGTEKKSGHTSTLKGRTLHAPCKDGVTPCRFLGYEFKSGRTTYRVLEDGTLTITRAGEVIVREKGRWEW